MTLSQFILDKLEPLLMDWDAYASARLPIARALDSNELRDSAGELLRAITADMASEQSTAEQREKAQGMQPHNAPAITVYSQRHAATRLTQGFTLDQMVSEYRALRASVMRRWAMSKSDDPDFEELVRFNESMDQSLVEAVAWYGARIEQARELFLGVLSHDLRVPLNTIAIGTQVLDRDKTLAGPSAKAVGFLQSASRRMTRMIADLLDFSQTRLGTRLPLAISRVQLRPVLRQVVGEMGSIHPGVHLSFVCEEDLLGDWDANRVAQMLANLIGNAILHGHAGQPVRVAAHCQDSQLIVTVHNTGPPIPPELLDRIFDPLARGLVREAEDRDHRSGLGLGLYISREIAQAHQGQIDVASSAAEGTMFTVVLPLRHKERANVSSLVAHPASL